MNNLLSKIPHIPNQLTAIVRRLVRWYLSPSGVLLAAALALSAVFFVSSGLTTSSWPAWFGLASTAMLGLFLPYRFARQQGRALDAVDKTTAAIKSVTHRQYRLEQKVGGDTGVAQGLNGQIGEVRSLVDELRSQLHRQHAHIERLEERLVMTNTAKDEQEDTVGARLLWLEQRNENAELRVEERLASLESMPAGVDGLRTELASLKTSIVGIDGDDSSGVPSVRQSVGELQARVVEIEGLIQRTNAEINEQSPHSEAIDATTTRLDRIAAVQAELESEVAALVRREGLSGATTSEGFHIDTRRLSDSDVAELVEWCSQIGIGMSERAISYIAHTVRCTEDALIGRMAGSLGSAVARTLVLRAIKSDSYHVVEIGSLFGVSVAAMEATTAEFFADRRFTVIDPLDGYYHEKDLDVLTGLPVSRASFDENMRRVGIGPDRLTVLQHLSTEKEAYGSVTAESADVLFIDGDHTRYGIEFDYRRYRHVVASGGFIIIDDYESKSWPEVTEFVNEVLMQDDGLHFVAKGWETAVFRVL